MISTEAIKGYIEKLRNSAHDAGRLAHWEDQNVFNEIATDLERLNLAPVPNKSKE